MGIGEVCTSPKEPHELLREFRATGSQEPFEEIVRRYAGMVYHICMQVTKNNHDAEDATQAVFLTLAVKARTTRDIKCLGPWLQQVAYRMSLDIIRARKRRQRREERHCEANGHDGCAPDASAQMGHDELKRLLNEELNRLPSKYRLPLILHYFGGLSREEMAHELNCKPSTLGVRLHRGRAMLGTRLAERGVVLAEGALAVALVGLVNSAVAESVVASTSAAAARLLIGGDLAAGMISARVLALTRGAAHAAVLGKLKMMAAIAVVAATAVAAGAQVAAKVRSNELRIPHLEAPRPPVPDLRLRLPQISEAEIQPQELANTHVAPQVHPESIWPLVEPTNPRAYGGMNLDPGVPGWYGRGLAVGIPMPAPRVETGPVRPPIYPKPGPAHDLESGPSWAGTGHAGSGFRPGASAGGSDPARRSPARTEPGVPPREGPAVDPPGQHNSPNPPSSPDPILPNPPPPVYLALVPHPALSAVGPAPAEPVSTLASMVSERPEPVRARLFDGGPLLMARESSLPPTVDRPDAFTLSGFGTVATNGFVDNSGRVIALGEGPGRERTLDLSGARAIFNSFDNPDEGGVNGWYARHFGQLKLPAVQVPAGTARAVWGESPDDLEIDLVNSLAFTFQPPPENDGQIHISLFSPDHGSIPSEGRSAPFIAVWSVQSDLPMETIHFTIRYDATDRLLESSELHLWRYSGGWQPLSPLDFVVDERRGLISASLGTVSYFAVGGAPTMNLGVPMSFGTPIHVVAPEPGCLLIFVGGTILMARRRRG